MHFNIFIILYNLQYDETYYIKKKSNYFYLIIIYLFIYLFINNL